MKIFTICLFTFFLIGCDTISIQPNKHECLVHMWNSDKVFRIESFDEKYIYLKEISGKELRKINYFSKGWNKVQCNQNFFNQSSNSH